jgi:uncharacterized protein
MDIEIGRIQAIYRYPVKSMAGESLEHAHMGWHGLEGDRRFAFRRVAEQGGFPWLTASKLPELILYKPIRQRESQDVNLPAPVVTDILDTAAYFASLSQDGSLPTHVVTPEGKVLEIRSDELRDEIISRFGAKVELMQLKHGIFDEAPISLISQVTTNKITDDSGKPHDIRRFRPNIVIEPVDGEPFAEDQWVGKTIVFGDGEDCPAVQVTLRDERCVMINLNPDTAQSDPALMKTVVQLNQNCAGVYATVIRMGALSVGQKVYLR